MNLNNHKKEIEFVKVDEFAVEDFFEDRGYRYGYVNLNGVRVIHIDKIECDANYDRSMDVDEVEEDYVKPPKVFQYYLRFAFEWSPGGMSGFGGFDNPEQAIEAAKTKAHDIAAIFFGISTILCGGAVSPPGFDLMLSVRRQNSVGVKVFPNKEVWVREDTFRSLNQKLNTSLGMVLNDKTIREIEDNAIRVLREGYVRGEVIFEDPSVGERARRKEHGWNKLEPYREQ